MVFFCINTNKSNFVKRKKCFAKNNPTRLEIKYDKVKKGRGNMKIYDFLDNYLEEDVIGKIYNNNFNLAEQEPSTEEYTEVMQSIKKQEKKLLYVEGFKKYLETRNIKDAIEAEEQFKLGFKTAVRIIIESYHF